ncbi:hypothetical protein [Azonexus sp.]|jgi:hypothetical protein|uniref:hypothetical protein n=1 Tax=Azonexus sp. TaxID=1872668 RepID=UPI0028374837|nr:hypothetical protein [Azonexus sp.]MDR1994561.1 hypothetical protein [Azonexus sp.]
MNWKRALRWVVIVLFVITATPYLFWFTLMRPSDYRKCDLYTKEMNGGIREFQGQPYHIVLCGKHAFIDPTNWPNNEVRLQVFSMDEELLAERFYEPLLGMRYNMQLEYYDDHIAYETKGTGPTQTIAMPPSRWEWLRAHLPRMWP